MEAEKVEAEKLEALHQERAKRAQRGDGEQRKSPSRNPSAAGNATESEAAKSAPEGGEKAK
jgi:hypothetical protein